MSGLFDSIPIGSLKLRNRFVRSATMEGMGGPDGSVTPRLASLMGELARGGVGLIITGHAYVSPEGQASVRQMGIHADSLIPAMRSMTDEVHEAGGVIAAQLAHAGCQAWEEAGGSGAIGPSSRPDIYAAPCREAGEPELEHIVGVFGSAAVRARRAGFDAVQLHAAHGYLLSQFLSPYFNHRSDRYGGDQESRSTLLVEVIRRVRSEAGEDYPVLIKINSEDFLKGGMSVAQMLRTVEILESEGVDAVELSGGTVYSGRWNPLRQGRFDTPEKEVFYREAAEAYKQRIGIPLILVGGIRSFNTAEALVEKGTADFIALARPLICEPGLIARWEAGERGPSICRSENRCLRAMRQGSELMCVAHEES